MSPQYMMILRKQTNKNDHLYSNPFYNLMKKIVYLILVLPFIILSCSNEDTIDALIEQENTKSINIVEIPSKSLFYDEIYEIRDGKEIDMSNTQNWTRATSTHEFYEITTVNPTLIFPGSVLSAQSINSGIYKPVGYSNLWKKLVTISYSLPVRSKEIAPKKSSFQNAIMEAIGNRDFSGKQSQIFTYKMKEFSYYSELKLAFGANVNIGNLFTLGVDYNEAKTTAVSALFIDFSQIYFSVDMDIPDDGNMFIDEITRQKYLSQNPVYINSVNYGRKGVIMVESEKSYKETSLAIRAALTAKVVNGKLELSTAHKELLEKAEIQICIIGGDGQAASKTIVGFHEFQNFIINGGVYTKEVYGVPISFGAAYVEDNSMFVTEFKVKHD